MIAFDSIAQMLQDTEQSGLPLWENILESDCRRQDLPRARSLERMGGHAGRHGAGGRELSGPGPLPTAACPGVTGPK